MTLPASVKIGPVEYVIKENARYKAENLVGQIMYYESVIEMQPDLSPQMALIGLWHEVFHGILLQGGFREHDERLLDVLAHGVVRLLQDNPGLIEVEKEVKTGAILDTKLYANNVDWNGTGLRGVKVAGINA